MKIENNKEIRVNYIENHITSLQFIHLFLIFKIKFWEQSARVIELEKKLAQLENEYHAEQELKLEKNFIMGKNRYEKTMRTLNYIKDKQIKLIQKSENYKNKLEQEIEK